jgi:hypothetical protein
LLNVIENSFFCFPDLPGKSEVVLATFVFCQQSSQATRLSS